MTVGSSVPRKPLRSLKSRATRIRPANASDATMLIGRILLDRSLKLLNWMANLLVGVCVMMMVMLIVGVIDVPRLVVVLVGLVVLVGMMVMAWWRGSIRLSRILLLHPAATTRPGASHALLLESLSSFATLA